LGSKAIFRRGNGRSNEEPAEYDLTGEEGTSGGGDREEQRRCPVARQGSRAPALQSPCHGGVG